MLQLILIAAGSLWFFGGVLTTNDSNAAQVHDFSVNVGGSATIALGLFFLVRRFLARGALTQGDGPEAGTHSPSPIHSRDPGVHWPADTGSDEAAPASPLSANWTGWLRRDDEILREYTFRGGQVVTGEVVIRLTLRFELGMQLMDIPPPLLAFVNLFVSPSLASAPLPLELELSISDGGDSTGRVSALSVPLAGGATLINFPGLEANTAVVRLCASGRDLELAIWSEREALAHLPLSNDARFNQLCQDLKAELLAAGATGE